MRQYKQPGTTIAGQLAVIARLLKRMLPDRAVDELRFFRELYRTSRQIAPTVPRKYQLRILSHLGGVHPRQCPCCGYDGMFRARSYPPRYDAQCPSCGSAERHRLFKLWLDTTSRLTGPGVSILHFAPEAIVRGIVTAGGARYASADIAPGRADMVLDIERIDQPDATFDLVICSHVLEHVDDRRALAEIFRILRPGGTAVIMTPVAEGWPDTYENPNVQSAAERDLHFGQSDHVRYFGSDIRQRITAAGFELTEFRAVEPFVARHGLLRGETIFLARRPALA